MGQIRARGLIFRITVTGNDGTETDPRTWRMRGPPGHTFKSAKFFIDFGPILGEISGAEDAHYRETGPIRTRKRIFRITVTGNDGKMSTSQSEICFLGPNLNLVII
ncbi:hypothetical protein DPMN_075538 [Dreissena polymorpha]|uniref:Uncharacterized protein n=1 Tax=Dreissena polymorpha TaxID=45954 RepID=A0A9D3YH76_DREPO|nr:hypothetical protein DPMN_075538 [Dreissena polymorpha]